jgi:hypothetical protein
MFRHTDTLQHMFRHTDTLQHMFRHMFLCCLHISSLGTATSMSHMPRPNYLISYPCFRHDACMHTCRNHFSNSCEALAHELQSYLSACVLVMPPVASKFRGASVPGSSSEPPKKRGRRSWADERAERNSRLAPGPSSQEDLANWPLAVADGLALDGHSSGEELMIRLRTNLTKTTTWTTDYSGLDCVRESSEMGVAGCTARFGWNFERTPLDFSRSCDCGTTQTEFLLRVARELDHGRPCHFRDIMDRLPAAGKEHILAAIPNKKASAAVRSAAYADMKEWIEMNRSWLFPVDATCWCEVHQQQCAVRPLVDGDDSVDNRLIRPIQINAAGVCCQGWSTEGAGNASGHSSEAPHAVWLQERKEFFDRQAEDLLFNECTPRYPAEQRMKAKFGDGVFVLSTTTGPELFGWPCKRMRKLTAVINKQTFVWLGPDDITEDFSNRFHRATLLDGEALFTADDEERSKEYSVLASSRSFNMSPADVPLTGKHELLTMVLPPGAIARMQDWHGVREGKQSQNGVLICDVDHNITAGSVAGADWPVQLTHGSIMCLKGDDKNDWRLATGLEHYSAMGFRMHRPTLGQFGFSKLHKIISDMPINKQKCLAGNGMHLLTQSAFMLYVMANIAPVDNRLPTSLNSSNSDWTEFEEDQA